jgi:hypothetical protein
LAKLKKTHWLIIPALPNIPLRLKYYAQSSFHRDDLSSLNSPDVEQLSKFPNKAVVNITSQQPLHHYLGGVIYIAEKT